MGFFDAIVQPFKEGVQNVGSGLGQIVQGKVGSGLKDIGRGYVDVVGGTIYKAGTEGGKELIGAFQRDPGGTIAQIGGAVASGGSSLLPGLAQAVQGSTGIAPPPSQLNSAINDTPSNAPTVVTVPVSQPGSKESNYTLPILIGAAGLTAIIILRKN